VSKPNPKLDLKFWCFGQIFHSSIWKCCLPTGLNIILLIVV